MKTYNLISTTLHDKRGGRDCFCALGIFAEEKEGEGAAEANKNSYDVFRKPEHRDALVAMADFLSPLYGSGGPWSPEWQEHFEVVYHANDRSKGGCSCGGDCPAESFEYVVPADKIKEALALAGIKVELNDFRGKDIKDDD